MVKKAKSAEQIKFEALPDYLQLFKLQEPKNNKRGVACIRDVCMFLERDQPNAAKRLIESEWDKITSYPDICKWLKEKKLAAQKAYVTY